MPVTIRDVAEAAGVSPMSVSKVLHGRGKNVRVSDETAALIRRIADDLQYRPNELARSFRQRRTRTLGLAFEGVIELSGPVRYFTDIVDGATRAAFDLNYSVTLCSRLTGPNPTFTLAEGRFDGLLWCRTHADEEELNFIRNCRIPVVFMHNPLCGMPTEQSHVGWDNASAVRMAMQHLAELGHKSVGFVVSTNNADNLEARLRRELFLAECQQLGIQGNAFIWDETLDAVRNWWQANPAETALIFWNDTSGIAMLHFARQLGIAIPQDLSVVSFDSTYQCDFTTPRLTALRQPLTDMAKRATELLIQRIENPETGPIHDMFPCVLDIRESTARPRLAP
ncbi:MAG: LacI family DNA-binding transcriptional regulator [Fimbriimonadaceae bacterium]|nr:LacI family DNA-binding transcriptional regulator [Fimbriimonadaceae bacterium]